MLTLEKQLPKGLSEEKDILVADKTIAQRNPLYIITSGYLYIKTKAGELIKLKLNTAQQKFFDKIVELRKAKKPIRIWLLKFRQGGFSTLIEAIIYAFTSQQENRNSLIMADETDKATNLFEMSKLYQEKLEEEYPHLAPPLRKSNAKRLEFEDLHSQIIIESAENIKAARSFTYQYVHLSECAFFPSLKDVLDALNQTVPDHADTIVIGETTANQMNDFYKEWMRAIEGKTDWIPMFMAWFLMDEYRMPLLNDQLYPLKGITFDADSSEIAFEKEEKELQEEFSLDDMQINWRRWAIVNKCQGDILTFKTEYPSVWQEAFSLSGGMFFDRKGLQRQQTIEPRAIGDIFNQDMKWDFRALEHGRIEIYEYPEKGEQYIVTTDASEGIGVDEAAALVLNKRSNATAAIVSGQHTPEELAHMAIGLGNYYNQAIIAPENKGYGYMVGQLVNKKYGNVYRRVRTAKGKDEKTEEIGYNTNSVTRPQYLAQLNEEIKNSSTNLYAKKLIDECNTFVIKKDKQGNVTKIEAQAGCQDGLVICRGIAGIVRQQYPYVRRDTDMAGKRRVRAREIKQEKNAGLTYGRR